MRRDVYIENDSGGFSVLAAAAVPAIIDDEREDDAGFVATWQAMLLELRGDDSMPVRIVADEPLSAEEQAQWLTRVAWRIDAPDGRILVMGGFDPDVLSWWQDSGAPDGDGRGVGCVRVAPGSWRVDLYAHVGSLNGRHVLREADEKPGAFFRRCHPGQPFPLWLAHMLDFSGEDDPGHEDLWRDVPASVREERLSLDTSSAGAIGLLVHLTPFAGDLPEAPSAGWFDHDAGARLPEVFPLGLPAGVEDPNLVSFADRALDRPRPKEQPPVATELVEIIETWSGDTLKRLAGGGERPLAPADAYLLHWMAALGSDSPPRFEIWVTPKGPWTPPAANEWFAVVQKGDAWAFGPPPNAGGWFTWWASGHATRALEGIPDGSTLMLATAPQGSDEDADPAVGRFLFGGEIGDGRWRITESSPAMSLDTLEEALGFVEALVGQRRLTVQGGAQRKAFDAAARVFANEEGALAWEGDDVRLTAEDDDERTLLLLASPVYRVRFGGSWAMDPNDDEDDEDDF